MDYLNNQRFNKMIGMIRRLQEKGQAEQQQTDALVDFIQDELTIDAMKKVAPILPVKENMQMGMGAIQNFAPITQKSMEMIRKNQTMNPTILKARGM